MDYVDYSQEEEDPGVYLARRGTEPTFPERLHFALESAEKDGHDEAISWQPHGRAFIVHDADKLTENVLKLYVSCVSCL